MTLGWNIESSIQGKESVSATAIVIPGVTNITKNRIEQPGPLAVTAQNVAFRICGARILKALRLRIQKPSHRQRSDLEDFLKYPHFRIVGSRGRRTLSYKLKQSLTF